MKKSTGALLATAVAGLFLAGKVMADSKPAAAPAPAPAKKVMCEGVNGCKGKGACKGMGNNSCAGKNGCKGKGIMEMTEADCKAKGGKVQKS